MTKMHLMTVLTGPYSNIFIHKPSSPKFNINPNLKTIVITITLGITAISEKTLAACHNAPGSAVIIGCDASSVHTATVGTGPGFNNITINLLPSAQINTGELTAISVDSNATINVQNGALVTNSAQSRDYSGAWGQGQNTIEMNNNTTLTVAPGAQVLATGLSTAGINNVVYIHGNGNTITNHGIIKSTSGPAIRFVSASGENIIDNYGVISYPNPQSLVISSEGGANLLLFNRAGGTISGGIYLGRGNHRVVLEAGSSLKGNYLNGGAGTNTLTLTDGAFGSGAVSVITNNINSFDTLTQNSGGHWQLSGRLANFSNVIINNGTMTLSGQNSYGGTTFINAGTLAAGAVNTFSPNTDFKIAPSGTMNLMGFGQRVRSIDNAGVIDFDGDGDTVLTINGNYAATNGRLHVNAHLYDDASQTDRLIINGNSSGTTFVSIKHADGGGAATLNGAKLITVNGLSEGEFKQSGRLVAGGYDYFLRRGAGANAANWYLMSTLIPVSDPGAEPIPGDMVERPEDAAYAGNLAAANQMFYASRESRTVETTYIDPLSGRQKSTSLWMTHQGGRNLSRDNSGQLGTRSNRYVLQMGGNIGQWSSNDHDSFRLGVMAGYGRTRSTTTSAISGYQASGAVDGYNLGIYGTWYADAAEQTGAYVDTWTQYGWFSNSVKGQDLARESYGSRGVSAGLGSGYTFALGDNAARHTAYFIQPHAQAIWMGVKADGHTEANGARVTGVGEGNIQSRLGMKAFMRTVSTLSNTLAPYIEANWVRNSNRFGAAMNGVAIKQSGADNIGEFKLGVDGQIAQNFNLSGNVSRQVGNHGYSDTAGMLGVKYVF